MKGMRGSTKVVVLAALMRMRLAFAFAHYVNHTGIPVSGTLPVPLSFGGAGGGQSYSGGYSGGVPPLPIPNREVKPARADGTAHPWESR